MDFTCYHSPIGILKLILFLRASKNFRFLAINSLQLHKGDFNAHELSTFGLLVRIDKKSL